MKMIPKEWIKCNLEDCTIILDSLRIPVNTEERQSRISGKGENELFPYYGATGEVGKIDGFIFKEELVALGEDGVPFLDSKKNKAYLLKGKTWVNNHAHVLKGMPGKLENRYLLHYLNQFDYHGFVNGVTRLKLTQNSMRKMPLLFPPLAEQKEIAFRLDNLLAQVESIKARIEKVAGIIKRFRQSVLESAVSGELTEEWRITNNGIPQIDIDSITQKYNKIRLPKSDLNFMIVESSTQFDNNIPDCWVLLTLGSLAFKITDGEHITPKRMDIGRYLLSARNIRDGYIDLTKIDYVSQIEFERIRKRCNPDMGDVLISCSGSVGRISLVDKQNEYVMVRSVAMVKPIHEIVNSKYLMYILQSVSLQKQIKERSKSTAQSNLFLGQIKELVIPFTTYEEQNEIVRCIELLFKYADVVEMQAKKAQKNIDNLTQSMLLKAFNGELTEEWREQHPELISGKNSAEALLERIKAERNTDSNNKKIRKPAKQLKR